MKQDFVSACFPILSPSNFLSGIPFETPIVEVRDPTYKEAKALPCFHQQVIPKEWEDRNGHLTVPRYMEIHGSGIEGIMQSCGLWNEEARKKHITTVSSRQHLAYPRESFAGDKISVHIRVLGLHKQDRVIRMMIYILNDTKEVISCMMEVEMLCLDTKLRKVRALEAEMAQTFLKYKVDADLTASWDTKLLSSPKL